MDGVQVETRAITILGLNVSSDVAGSSFLQENHRKGVGENAEEEIDALRRERVAAQSAAQLTETEPV
ncbi:unnamed protein product, partial [Amoebophrya sp. A120]|eukprot:GSA120T00026045001.1